MSVLSTEHVAAYERDGIVKITLPREIQDLQRAFLGESCRFLARWGAAGCTPESLPFDLARVAKENRALVGRLYKVSRRFVSAKRLACAPAFVDIAAMLMGTASVSCCTFVAARMDLPEEEKFLLDAHQDFPYIQGSLNGVTIWLPFHNVTERMGVPSWIPGSHGWGALEVEEYGLDEVGGSGGRSFAVVPDERVADEAFVREPVGGDEALVFHTLLVHRSESNTSESARMSVQVRFDDLTSDESFGRNFPEGLYLGDSLGKTYPEFVRARM